MNKAFKIILITSITVLGTGFLAMPSISAAQPAPDNLVVQFQTGALPLFSEANFMPGEGVTRWIKVTNNSPSVQKIATEAINKSDPDGLAAQMNLTIKEGATTLYNNTLAHFFSNGETYLSDLAGGGTMKQYDFTITFDSGTGNSFQGKALGFDLLIGFQGTQGGLTGATPIAGGGYIPEGLTIAEESIRVIPGNTSATIIWTTSYQSTSQVIYGRSDESHTLDLSDNAGTPPKYGYAHTTPEDTLKVTSHSVTISGLTTGATYYFRAVSHGSFALSLQYTFVAQSGSGNTNQDAGQGTADEGGGTGGKETEGNNFAVLSATDDKALSPGNEIIALGENQPEMTGLSQAVNEQEAVNPANNNQAAEQEKAGLGTRLLAAIAAIPINVNSIIILLIIIVFCLILLELFGKKKKKVRVRK